MGNVKQISGDVSEPVALAMGDSGAENWLASWIVRQIMQESADGRVVRFVVNRCESGRRLGVQLEDIGIFEASKIQRMTEEDRNLYLSNVIRDIYLAAAVDAHGPCSASEYAVAVYRDSDPNRRRSTCFFAPNDAPQDGSRGGENGAEAAMMLRQSYRHLEVTTQSVVMLVAAQAANAESMGKFWANAAQAKEAENARLRQELEAKAKLIADAETHAHERELESMQVAQEMRLEDSKQKRWDDLFGWVVKTGGPMIMDWIGEAKKDPDAKPAPKLVQLGQIIDELPDDAKGEFLAMFMGLPQEQALCWRKILTDINEAKLAADRAKFKDGDGKVKQVKQLIDDLPPPMRKQFDGIMGKLTPAQRAAWEAVLAGTKET